MGAFSTVYFYKIFLLLGGFLQAILVIHVPVCFRNFSIHDSPKFGTFFLPFKNLLLDELFSVLTLNKGHIILTS